MFILFLGVQLTTKIYTSNIESLCVSCTFSFKEDGVSRDLADTQGIGIFVEHSQHTLTSLPIGRCFYGEVITDARS
jgi:hypothetical protein